MELFSRETAQVGEGPVWLTAVGALSWVDITEGVWHRTAPDAGLDYSVRLDTMLGALTPASDGGWLAAVAEGFLSVTSDGSAVRALDVIRNPLHRMNDAKCDSRGRYWAGSTALDFSPGEGALHRLDADWVSTTVLTGLTLPNGLGWSPDDRTFYLVDSVTRSLFAFDFDADSGDISRRRELAFWRESDGIPDGLAVAADGSLWIAFWGAGEIRRFSPAGQQLGSLRVPTRQPASCAFADGTRLIVTTARRGMDEDALREEPLAGSVFVADVGVSGVPVSAFAGATLPAG